MHVDMSGTTFAKLLDKNCLEGHNFPSWYHNLKIVLTLEKIVYVLNSTPSPILPDESASEEERASFKKHVDDGTQARCYILAFLNEELQKQHEEIITVGDIIYHLEELYDEGKCSRRYSAICELMRTKMVKGAPVHQHGLKMISLSGLLWEPNWPLTSFWCLSLIHFPSLS